jgi:rare lipoprotein A
MYVALGLALALAGCAMQPVPQQSRPQTDAVPVSPAPDEAKARAPRAPLRTDPAPPGRGGYYLDDGPGDDPPADLTAIPDAVPRAEPLRAANARPYNAMGRDYVPRTSLAPYFARGTASWYGRRYHGKPTSSGEPYDMYAMTAAHPTLPIPSYLRVTALANGRTVVVRVNDRGPFHSDRLIDLSYTAAWKLGLVAGGSGRVEVVQLLPGDANWVAAVEAGKAAPAVSRAPSGPGVDPPAVAGAAAPGPVATPSVSAGAAPVGGPNGDRGDPGSPEPTGPTATARAAAPIVTAADPAAGPRGVFVQLGAFSDRANAEDFARKMAVELSGLGDALVVLGGVDARWRVQTGPFADRARARLEAERIAGRLGGRPFVVER